MGLFLRQTDDRSRLQTRLAEELREKVRASQQTAGAQPEVEPELLADGRQTRPAGMVFLILAAIFLAVIVILVITTL